MPDVFLSYSTKDEPGFARLLVERLTELGIDVWWDVQLLAGDRFGRAVQEKIDDSKAVIVIWSENSIDSEWVYAEADIARRTNKFVPVHVPTLDISKIPPPFNAIHSTAIEDFSSIERSLESHNVCPKSRARNGASHPSRPVTHATEVASTTSASVSDFAVYYGSIAIAVIFILVVVLINLP